MTRRRGPGAILLCGLALGACSGGGDTEHVTPEARGKRLFSGGLAKNPFACATCHAAGTPSTPVLFPGAPLGGSTRRPSYWGGAERSLLRALGYCQTSFMGFSTPLDQAEPAAADLYAYLDSLSGPEDALPFTVVGTVSDLPAGDATRGLGVYDASCGRCHGDIATGQGSLSRSIPILPDDVLADHEDFTPEDQRLVFVEKVRHGVFLGYGGSMPPFSLEVLADDELSDVLSALGLDR